MNHSPRLLLALLGALACWPCSLAIAAPVHLELCKPRHRNTPTKTCIVDGDTLWLSGEKIRLEGFDTPEVSAPKCSSEKLLGKTATERLAALLNGADWALTKSGEKDRYNRTIGTITIAGRDVGEVLIAEGLARVWKGHRVSWCD